MLSGYIAAVVTPFKNGKLDLPSFEKYINHVMSQGVSGVVICGSTGESLALSLQEKIELLRVAYEVIDGKIEIICGVIEPITLNCLELMEKAEKFSDYFLCISPFYVKASGDQIFHHFKILSESTDKEIIIYNNPERAGIDIDFDMLQKLCNLKNIVAIKECSTNLSKYAPKYMHLKEKFSFLAGNDELVCAALAMGASGAISVSANVAANLCLKMYKSFQQKDLERFGVLRDVLAPLHELIFTEPSPASIKYLLSKFGFMQNELRAPLTPISKALEARIDAYIAKIDLV
ncbi:MAG: 4-hydroxy-tetrahydrodipicolinate synthase [Holosporaceae bacterium]|jgi:4-hydroxy-tetrahydrodipicolinate synthase|nr:4-hydroxy-tetrahydrodipicolinate synthase [Holosporaceae bacterium]